MANKKIKHIVAKLLGESTEETLDIYDESALHATDIVDNLTSTDATKVLSAKQGKALNDSLSNSVWVQSGSTAIRTNSRKSLMISDDTAVTVWNNANLLYYLACVKYTSWGTSLSVTVHNNNIHGFLLINGDLFVVWMPSTSDINVIAHVTSGIFSKSGRGSCTFGPASSSSIYKLTRNGNTFTLTSTSSVAIVWIGTT